MARCRNPRCGDYVPPGHPLCPSCRLAGEWGAVLVALLVGLLKLAGLL